jgi:hypothetical protein
VRLIELRIFWVPAFSELVLIDDTDYLVLFRYRRGPIRPSANRNQKNGQVLFRIFDSENRRVWQSSAPGFGVGFGCEEHEMRTPVTDTIIEICLPGQHVGHRSGLRTSAKGHEGVIAFSLAMFDHADEYREIYHAILHTRAWPLVRHGLQDVLGELIRRECKAEIENLKHSDSEVPVDLFVYYLTSAFLSVLIWWLDRRSRLTPSQIDGVFRSLVLPTVRGILR